MAALRYALPYYTRDKADTEYLISNPNAAPVTGLLSVYDKTCKVAKQLSVTIDPPCTMAVRLKAIVPDNAGHAILEVSDKVSAQLLYFWEMPQGLNSQIGLVLTASDLAGTDQVLDTTTTPQAYVFGYRTLSLGRDQLSGAVCISNPGGALLTGLIKFYDQKCKKIDEQKIEISPGCTQQYFFPKDCYGFGRIDVSSQAVANVLHTSGGAPGIVAAELAADMRRLGAPAVVPAPPPVAPVPPEEGPPGIEPNLRRVLFDATHGCTPASHYWDSYQAAVNAAGHTVSQLTTTPVSVDVLDDHDVFVIAAPTQRYSAEELNHIAGYVQFGGSVFVVGDRGVATPPGSGVTPLPWTVPTRDVLRRLHAMDDGNVLRDAVRNVGGNDTAVFYDPGDFYPHPIVLGINKITTAAACSVRPDSPLPWTRIIVTRVPGGDADRTLLMGTRINVGRVLVYGDNDTFGNTMLGEFDNRQFGLRCIDWLLYRNG